MRQPPTTIDINGPTNVGDPTAYLPRVRRPADASPSDERPVDMINRVLDERRADTPPPPNARPRRAGRIRRRDRDQNRPAATVRDVAAARQAREEQASIHADIHQRHMDALEVVRAYLGVLCLLGLFVLVVGMAVVAFMILTGGFAWAPVKP